MHGTVCVHYAQAKLNPVYTHTTVDVKGEDRYSLAVVSLLPGSCETP